jgi:GNAT superfamily N-acetyltransferase
MESRMARHFAALEKAVHNRAAFNCGVPELDNYLKTQATQDQKRNVSQPYVLTDEAGTIYGYYTLSSGSVNLEQLPETARKGLPHYPQMPVILLGRLATDQRFQGQGIGASLLADALKRSYEVSQSIGALAVVIQAKNDQAASFYRKHEFISSQTDPHVLMLPMKTIATLM